MQEEPLTWSAPPRWGDGLLLAFSFIEMRVFLAVGQSGFYRDSLTCSAPWEFLGGLSWGFKVFAVFLHL
jgi:hypothetical protein